MIYFAILIICTFLGGCTKKAEKTKVRPVALVITAFATQANVPVLIKAIGNMEASEIVAIRSQINGELTKVAFREGQDIQKGDLLFQLDPRSYQAELIRAEASMSRNVSIMNLSLIHI